jgi:two-component system, OmpR family, phosphate regulon response regulator PhoB
MVPKKANPSSSFRILLVEDEADIRDLISLHLGREGYAVESAIDGEEGLRKLRQAPYDLLVLDWMLPGISGLELTRIFRSPASASEIPASGAPILMVTARMEAADIVLGLEAGADDYVTKPFEIPVLLARVRALLRRSKQTVEKPGAPLVLGDVWIDPNSYEVKCAGELLSLTPSEFKLLLALAQNRGRVLTRDRLIDCVQGAGVTVVDRAIDTHIFGLRKKLGACADVIETVRGVGYRVRSDSDPAQPGG